jgi:hypothetical protein
MVQTAGVPIVNYMMLRRIMHMLQQFCECRWLSIFTAESHFRIWHEPTVPDSAQGSPYFDSDDQGKFT